MKLNINTNAIRKGMLLAGLSLVCVSASGCVKETPVDDYSVVDNKDDDNKLEIATAKETLEVLNAYNSMLKGKKLNVNDLEYMSSFNNGMFSIKYDNGELYQLDGENYNMTDTFGNSIVMFGKEAPRNSIKVGEYIEKNDIKINAYTFQKEVAFSGRAKKEITEKYGKDTFECVKTYGLPVAMYDWKDFSTKKANVGKTITKSL